MALPNPIQSYFVPVREEDLIKAGPAEGDFETISRSSTTDDSPIESLVSVAVAAAGTIVVFDHWEDGYELDLTNPVQSTTLVWGDGISANGTAPGVPGDVFSGGESFVVQSTVPVDRDTGDILFDGGDQISATFPIAVTRAAFPTDTGSVIAGATEALDTDSFGDTFVMPFGVDTDDDDTNAFQVTSAHVMASAPNTPVYLNGTLVATLSEAGETFVVENVEEGDEVRTYDAATETEGNGVQVTLVTGDENSGYETRWYSLLPRGSWSNDYYTPVFTGENGIDDDSSSFYGPTQVWVYNPNATDLDVTIEAAGGASMTFSVPAGESRLSPIIPNDSGARLFTADGRDFFAVTQTDTTGPGQTNDWGHPLVPATQLTSQAIIGLGFGNTEQIFGDNSGDNRSPVWVAATKDETTVKVDYDGDGTVDDSFELDRLESRKVVDDDDNNMSGAIIFAEDEDGNPVDIAVAYGQDAQTRADESDSLDFGTVVPPLPELEASKNVRLKEDADGDGRISPGDVVTFSINVLNFGRVDVGPGGYVVDDQGIPVFDLIGEGDGDGPLVYVEDSTQIDTGGGATAIADGGASTAFPLDGAGYTSTDALEAGESHVITFDARVKDFDDLAPGTIDFTNRGALETPGDGEIDTFDVTRPLAFESEIDIEKSTNGEDADTPADAVRLGEGEAVTWTYEVTNRGETHLANVDVSDDKGVAVAYQSGDADGDDVLDPGETWVFTGTGTATSGDYVNEGSVKADAVFADGTTPVPANLGGGTVTDADKSHYVGLATGSLAGRVFEDAEADGIEDAAAIAGATVELLDDGGSVVATTTTDATGAYLFADVPAGDYTVRFTKPSGFDAASPQDEGDDATDSDGDPASLITDTVTVAAGENVTDVDQGFYRLGEIGDRVFDDADGDGIQDAGEGGVGGVEVRLRDAGGTVVATTTSDADGLYTFDAVEPGTYTVEFDVPAGRFVSPEGAGGDPSADSDAAADGTTGPVTIASGEVNDTVDAGLTTPGVSLEKTASTGQVAKAGETVTYSYTVTNTGSTPLTGVVLSDAGFTAAPGDDLTPTLTGGDTDGDGVLDVGEAWTYTAEETITQAQIDAGADLTNVATVDTKETGPVSAKATVSVDAAPALAFDKAVTDVAGNGPAGKITAAGQVISYTLTATNTGEVTLTNVTIVDPLTDVSKTVPELAPGADVSVDATYTVTQDDLDDNGGGDGDIDNVATADSDQTGKEKDAEAVLIELSPAMAVVKTASADSVSADGEPVTFTYTVTNEGNVALTDVTLTDDNWTPAEASDDFAPAFTGGDTDGDGKLDVGETWTYEATVAVGQDAIDAGSDLVNVATADSAETDPVTDEATVTVEQAPKLGFDKEVTDVDGRGPGAKVTEAGQVITYALTATNEGNTTLTNVTIVDPLTGTAKSVGDLSPGASASVTATYAVTQADLDDNGGGDGDIDNVATADSDQTGKKKDAEAVLIEQSPAIGIVKTADKASVDAAGETVTFTYTVTNEGNVALTDVTVTDDNWTPGEASDDFAPAFTGGDTDGDGQLDVGETWTYEATVAVGQDAIDAGATLVNVATADSAETGPKTDEAAVKVEQRPDLAVVKAVSAVNGDASDLAIREAGDVVTWTITVTNTGNETLDDIAVEDPALGLSETVATLAPGAEASFKVDYTATQADIDGNGGGDGAIENVAVAADDRAGKDTDEAEVPVVRDPALTVAKTATAVNGEASDLTVRAAGDEITYEIVVTNSGNETLDHILVKDPKLGFATVVPELAPGEARTFEVSYTATQEDIDTDGGGDGDIDNVAVAKDDRAGTAKDREEVKIDRAPDLEFDKQVLAVDGDPGRTTVDAAGQTISYALLVTNAGNTTLTNVTVEDPLTGASVKLAELAPGDEAVIHTDYTVTQEDIDTSQWVRNVATADSDETPKEKDAEKVLIEREPALAIVKTADKATVTKAGEAITYTYAVSNTGNVTLTDVTLTDDNATPGDASDDLVFDFTDVVAGDADGDGELDLGETWTFEATVAVTDAQLEAEAPLVNLATVATAEGAEASDTATVEVDAPDRCTDIEDHFDRPDGPDGATIVVAPHLPHRNGSNDDDFVWGDGRGNTISVNEGENVVVANGGDDIVNGGNAGDEMYGDGGNDILNGNGGDDLLSGGKGHDKLYGAHGDDKILAGAGRDLVEGGGGDDRIHMGAGNDTVQGEGGDDCIAGGTDGGRIKGDVASGLTVKLGDEMFGNGGADTFEYEAGDGVDFLFDFKAEDGDTLKLFGIEEDQATAVTANTPYGPAAGLAFDLDGDGKFDGGVFFQQVRETGEVEEMVDNGVVEYL